MKRSNIRQEVYDNLPKELKNITEGYVGREKDIVLLSSIGVLSNCIPNLYGIYDGNKIYPHLFIVIIAPPASGKGTMNHSRLIIDKIHKQVYKDSITNKKNGVNPKKKKEVNLKLM